jgi:hypothetical protein
MTARPTLSERVRYRAAVAYDLWNWRRVLSTLRCAERPPAQRTVLFCNLLTMLSTAKVESLMAGVLRLKGFQPVILLERPQWAIEKIFRAAAADAKFIYLDTWMDRARMDAAGENADAILARSASFEDLARLEIDGYRIGRNVQSLVLRQLRVGRLDNNDPRHHVAVKATLTRSLVAKEFVENMMKERAPNVAIFIERGYTPAGEIFDGCLLHGVDAVQWCSAPQSDCLIYRRYRRNTRGEHPLALSDVTWRGLMAMPWTEENDRAVVERIAANYASGAWYNRQQLQEGKAIVEAARVRDLLGLDPAKKTAIVFCHILYDATFFYGESLFEDYQHWLVETVRAAIGNPQLNWIVKVHPVNVWRSRMDGAEMVQLETEALREAFGNLSGHVKLMGADTPINTFSLFDVADYGLTVRGTIGMELPCFGIPVITAGTGRYSGRGFTTDPATCREYIELLGRLHELPRLDADAVRRARCHYFGALSLRPIPMRSFVLDYYPPARFGLPSQQDVYLRRRADQGLLDTEDLGRFVHWITSTQEPELLARSIEPAMQATALS